ncbi:hypothetical protein METH109765_11230 [Mesobacillus thioparans]
MSTGILFVFNLERQESYMVGKNIISAAWRARCSGIMLKQGNSIGRRSQMLVFFK